MTINQRTLRGCCAEVREKGVRKERMAWIHPQVGKSVTHQPFHDE